MTPIIKFHQTAQVRVSLKFQEPIAIEQGAIVSECEIGAFSFIGRTAEIYKTKLGRYCSIGPGCKVGPGNHPIDRITSSSVTYNDYFAFFTDNTAIVSPFETSASVHIGNDVWLGADAVIMNGVSIGNGAVVAANSVVTKDVPPYAIVGGAPAKIIRYRFSDSIIERLVKLEWWKYDLAAWGKRSDLPPFGSLDERLLDQMEKAQPSAPLLSGRRFDVTFDVNTPIITIVPNE